MSERWLDLRFLTGLLFTVYGVILSIYGLIFRPHSVVAWNMDLWWGIVILVFGIVFLGISRIEPRSDD